MQKTIVTIPELKLIGLKIRTSYQLESHAKTANIGKLVGRYWNENISEKIPNRKNPGVRIAAFSSYSTNEYGSYDYYIGEEVSSLDFLPDGLSALTIPSGKYLKLTSSAGKIPDVIISSWMQIWKMTEDKILGGERIYNVDFEIYDQRAKDPNNTVFDIYLGVKIK